MTSTRQVRTPLWKNIRSFGWWYSGERSYVW